MSGEGTFDVWIQSFAPGSDPVPALQRVFGVDERAAIAIEQTIPRAVRRNATREEAEEMAAALRAIGAKVELRASRGEPRASVAGAHPSPVAAPPSSPPVPPLDASLVPVDPTVPSSPPADPDAAALTPSEGALELAFDPADQRTRAPRSAPRVSHERAGPPPAPLPAAPTESPSTGSSLPTVTFTPPAWLKGLGIALLFSVAAFGFRAARCYCRVADAMNATPEEIAALEAEGDAESLANAVDVQAFLARSNAQLGADQDRNGGLAATLRRQGAVRVLAADIARMSGVDMAFTLIVELPEAPAARRRIAATVEGYYAGDSSIRPEDVDPPAPDQRYLFVELE